MHGDNTLKWSFAHPDEKKEEATLLSCDLLTGVTQFFRDPEASEAD